MKFNMKKKLKKNNFFKKFLNLEKTCWKLETNYDIVENIRLTSINAKIRNFKNEKILNFLIDFLIESGPDL